MYTFFWKTGEHYGCFSNWYEASFIAEDKRFLNSEQYMMWKKAMLFNDEEIADAIMKETSPWKQKALGRKVKNFDVKVWEQKCYGIVYKGNKYKFDQNLRLKQILLSTRGTEICEASPVDNIWGVGMAADNKDIEDKSKWKGLNLLGKVLTELRTYYEEGGL